MATAEYMSENERAAYGAGLGLVGLAGIGILAGLVVAVVPVVGQSLRPINLAPVNFAMTAVAGVGLLLAALGLVLRQAGAVYRGAGVAAGILLIAAAAAFLIAPLAGLITLTLATCGAFVALAGTYLFGPVDEAADDERDAAEPVETPAQDARRSAEVIRHPSWHTPLPANLPRAVALKQEVCKPHARLML